MNFLDYKNHLLSNNIKLFDDDYRISYYNLNILNDSILNNNQHGGGKIDNNNYISPMTIIKRDDTKLIELLVNNLISNNFDGAKYLCQSDIVLKYV